MAVSNENIIIVGAGQAGGRAAEAMRQAGFAGRIVIVGEESHPPYERPPLSKEMLASDVAFEKCYLNPADFYGTQNIELQLETRVEGLDAKAHRLTLSGRHKGELAYDKLLLVTGARVRTLPTEGAHLPGIHYIRTIADSQALKPYLKPEARVIVIGGGFIGLETAASARLRGCAVTVLEMQPTLLTRVCDRWVGEWYAKLHRDRGVTVLTAASVVRVEGKDKVERVVLADGSALTADVVVVGIGIIPNIELARDAGIATDNGIVVDEFGRSSDADVYAAGDVANLPNIIHGHRVRLESWANAQNGGIAVARNMVGEPAPYNDVAWFWSDQYDVNLQIAGVPRGWDKVVTRGDPASGKFMLFYLHEGRVVAVNTFNLGREMRFGRKLIESGRTVSEADLANEAIKMKDLAA